MSAAKKSIVETFKSIKHQLDICAELIDVCVQQGTLK